MLENDIMPGCFLFSQCRGETEACLLVYHMDL